MGFLLHNSSILFYAAIYVHFALVDDELRCGREVARTLNPAAIRKLRIGTKVCDHVFASRGGAFEF